MACAGGDDRRVESWGSGGWGRGLVLALGAVAAMLLAAPGQALAASLTVTPTDDPTSGTCVASSCSLRQAINLADTDGASDAINIPAGTYQLSSAAGGALAISPSMTVRGAGGGAGRVLPAAGDEAIAISSGNVAINGLTFANSTTTTDGGAI